MVIIELQVGTCKDRPVFEALGYGVAGEPNPEMLLFRGTRCSSFQSEQQAQEAVVSSSKLWMANNLKFHLGKQVRFVTVEPVKKNRSKPHCPQCGNKKSENWRTVYNDGRKPENFFVCCKCKYKFKRIP